MENIEKEIKRLRIKRKKLLKEKTIKKKLLAKIAEARSNEKTKIERMTPENLKIDKLLYNRNYDKNLYNTIRRDGEWIYYMLIAEAKVTAYITDPYALARILKLLNQMHIILLTYNERISERDKLERELLTAKSFPLTGKNGLLKQYSIIQDKFIKLLAKQHNFERLICPPPPKS